MKRQERMPVALIAALFVLSMTATGCYTTISSTSGVHPASGWERARVEYDRSPAEETVDGADSTLAADADSTGAGLKRDAYDRVDEEKDVVIINRYYVGYDPSPGFLYRGRYWNDPWRWHARSRPWPYRRTGISIYFGPRDPSYVDVWGVWSWSYPWDMAYGTNAYCWYDSSWDTWYGCDSWPWYDAWYWYDPWYSWYDPWYQYDPWYVHNPWPRDHFREPVHGGGGGGDDGPGNNSRITRTDRLGGFGVVNTRRDGTVTAGGSAEKTSSGTVTSTPRTRTDGRTTGTRRSTAGEPGGTTNKSTVETGSSQTSTRRGTVVSRDGSFFEVLGRRISQEIDTQIMGSARRDIDATAKTQNGTSVRRSTGESSGGRSSQPESRSYSRSRIVREIIGEAVGVQSGTTSVRRSSSGGDDSGTQDTGSSESSTQRRSYTESSSNSSSSQQSSGSSGSSSGSSVQSAPRQTSSSSGGGGGGQSRSDSRSGGGSGSRRR